MFENVNEALNDEIKLREIVDIIKNGNYLTPEEYEFVHNFVKNISIKECSDIINKDYILTILNAGYLKRLITNKFIHEDINNKETLNFLAEINDQALIERVFSQKLDNYIKENKDNLEDRKDLREISELVKDKKSLVSFLNCYKGFRGSSDFFAYVLTHDEITSNDIEESINNITINKFKKKIDVEELNKKREDYVLNDFEKRKIINEASYIKKCIENDEQEKLKEYCQSLFQDIAFYNCDKYTYLVAIFDKIKDEKWKEQKFMYFETIFKYNSKNGFKNNIIRKKSIKNFIDNINLDEYFNILNVPEKIYIYDEDMIECICEEYKNDENFISLCEEKAKSFDFNKYMVCFQNSILKSFLKTTKNVYLINELIGKAKKSKKYILYNCIDILPEDYLKTLSCEEIFEICKEDNTNFIDALKTLNKDPNLIMDFINDEKNENYTCIRFLTNIVPELTKRCLEVKKYKNYKEAKENFEEKSSDNKKDIFYETGEYSGIHNIYSYDQIKKINKEVDKILKDIDVPKNNENEQLQAFLKLCENLSYIKYDYNAIRKKSEKNKRLQDECRNLCGLFSGKTVCVGYSTNICELAPFLNIKARYISGARNRKPGHAWNQVKIGNKWFNLDYTEARDKIARKGYASPSILELDKKFNKSHSKKKYPRDSVDKEQICDEPLDENIVSEINSNNKFKEKRREVAKAIRTLRIPFNKIEEKKDEIMKYLNNLKIGKKRKNQELEK